MRSRSRNSSTRIAFAAAGIEHARAGGQGAEIAPRKRRASARRSDSSPSRDWACDGNRRASRIHRKAPRARALPSLARLGGWRRRRQHAGGRRRELAGRGPGRDARASRGRRGLAGVLCSGRRSRLDPERQAVGVRRREDRWLPLLRIAAAAASSVAFGSSPSPLASSVGSGMIGGAHRRCAAVRLAGGAIAAVLVGRIRMRSYSDASARRPTAGAAM